MNDHPETHRDQEEQKSYVPASPIKRIIAWVGVVYMVCLVFLNVYPFFHQGAYLTGIAPLFACPGIAGMFAVAVYLLRSPDSTYARKVSMGILAVLCAVGFVGSLALGIPALLANFGGGQ